jgi:hypothetical protein
MKTTGFTESATRVLFSPANWIGTSLAAGTVAMVGMGWLAASWLPIGALAYGAGFAVGGVWFGWPKLSGPDWSELSFADDEDTRAATTRALAAIRRLVEANPGRRLSANTGIKLNKLCDSIEAMLKQWEKASDGLSLEDTFHARNIALRYLPEALQRFWTIPVNLAHTKQLENGLTADATLGQTADDLTAKVNALSEALAAHDTQAFLDHSKFLSEKFSGSLRKNDDPVRLN